MVDSNSAWQADTAPEAAQVQVEIFRRMAPEKRLEYAALLAEGCRRRLADGVRQRHPDYDERRVHLAVIRLLLPDGLFRAAYPAAQEIQP